MNNNYEAAEVALVGSAQETILGMKDLPIMDNVADPDMWYQASSLTFDE